MYMCCSFLHACSERMLGCTMSCLHFSILLCLEAEGSPALIACYSSRSSKISRAHISSEMSRRCFERCIRIAWHASLHRAYLAIGTAA